ncbi:xylose transport system permease protein XylH-like [Saccostrea echinata]|uniref:xylose transport system permease protein XylH-like n=1 Tax=Saccostrea echinata TaxID=191078 RepID=UPI002A83FC37|nr:xylose transport system permease protein XylH-like [Saccostrea echinata]
MSEGQSVGEFSAEEASQESFMQKSMRRSIAGFVGAVSATLILKSQLPVLPAIVLSLAVGLCIGMWHGFWIAWIGVPSFIVTLGGMLMFRGFTLAILKGSSLAPLPGSYQFLAAGFLPEIGKVRGLNIMSILVGLLFSIWYIISEWCRRKQALSYGFTVLAPQLLLIKILAILATVNYFTIQLSRYRGIPVVLLIIAVLVIIYTFITQKTIPGRHIYAYGGNKLAAELSGVNTRQVIFLVYANMGLLAAWSGIIFTGRLNSATPKTGMNFELDAIAACFVGGASMSGGIGTVIGAVVGALLMGVLNNGMSILGVSIEWQQAIKGFVLICAVAFDVYAKSGSKA